MTAPAVTGLDHETDVNGECMPGCVACRVERLERTVERVREKCKEIVVYMAHTDGDEARGYSLAASEILREIERGEG